MKKFIFGVALLFFIISFYALDSYQTKKNISLLLYKDTTEINIDFNDETNYNEFVENIVEFSKQNNVSVIKHAFLNENTINIYTTNFNTLDSLFLSYNEFPSQTSNGYITNKQTNTNIGQIKIPETFIKMKIYPFKNVENIGLGTKFLIYSKKETSLNKTLNYISTFGVVKVNNQSQKLVDFPFEKEPLLIIFTLFIFLLILLLYYVNLNSKLIAIQNLLGLSKKKITFYFCTKISILVFASSITGFSIFYFANTRLTMFPTNPSTIFLFLVTTLLTIIVLNSFLLLFLIIKMRNSNIILSLKGEESIKKMKNITFIFKIIVTILMFISVSGVTNAYSHLRSEIKQLKYWESTKNIYSLSLTELPVNDLEKERQVSDNFKQFYHLLTSKYNGFIINATNFIPLDDIPTYSYSLNEEVFTVNGNSVIIDENYLKINKIESYLDKSIDSQLLSDENTLNVLVPIKYKSMEISIKNSLLEDFYFQKVTVKDIYNKALKQPLEKLTKPDLNINLIYVKNDQKYFTFSAKYGISENDYKITDPLAIIYNDTIDSSFILAYATSSLYFSNKNPNPYHEIKPILEETRTSGNVNFVTSVYNSANNKIVFLQKNLRNQIVAFILLISVTFLLLINFVYLFYKANKQLIQNQFLFGFNYWKINKNIIIFSALLNFTCAIVLYSTSSEPLWLIFGGILFSFELIIIAILKKIFLKKSISILIKEGR